MYAFRKAKSSDAIMLADLSATTFRFTYSPTNKKSDIDFFIANNCHPEQIREEIADKNLDYFLFYSKSSLVGYCKLRYHLNEHKIEVARFYLTEAHIGTGAAKIFMEHLLKFSKENHFEFVELSVWKENKRAIRFYEKIHFKICGETTFDWGTGKVDEDFLMERKIVEE